MKKTGDGVDTSTGAPLACAPLYFTSGSPPTHDLPCGRPIPLSDLLYMLLNSIIFIRAIFLTLVTLLQRKRSTLSKNVRSSTEVKLLRGLRSRKKDTDTSSSTPALTPDKEIPVKEEEEPLDAEILSSSPAPELSPSPETPKATPVREPDVVMEEYYKRSRRRSTRELSPITPESWRSWTWGQLKEPVWVIATYPASDSGINGNPNTMGGSFDSFRVSPQPTQLLK